MEQEILNMKEELLKQMKDSKIVIKSMEETVDVLLKEKKSIARFGDGEFDIIRGGERRFQTANIELAKRLREVLCSKQDFCLLGIPEALNGFENLMDFAEKFWIVNMSKCRNIWLDYLHEDVVYYSTNITRPYMDYKDKSFSSSHFEHLKRLWSDRNILICEGKYSRLGIGNDLFDCCKSIKRIICPAENAFDKYDEILDVLKSQSKDLLVLIALGPTATVLAYDLAIEGYQAMDVGHVDIEYEWFKRGALKKEKIEYKYVNEVSDGNIVQTIDDEKYKEQIIASIE